MLRPSLSRAAGPFLLLVGTLMTVNELVMASFVDKSDRYARAATQANALFVPTAVSHFAVFVGLLLVLVLAYAWQAREGGTLGIVSVGAAVVGTVLLAGDLWFEAFAVPWLASVAPDVIAVPPTSGMLVIGAVFSYWGFSVGWLAFGIASLRAHVFPAGISIAIVATAVLSAIPPFFVISPPNAIPLALVVAGWGAWMMRTTTAAAADVAPVQARLSWR